MEKKISEKASTQEGDGPDEGWERDFRRSGPKSGGREDSFPFSFTILFFCDRLAQMNASE
jgi:hypothetical protein